MATTPNPDAGAPKPTAANLPQPNQPSTEPVPMKGRKMVPLQTVVLYRKDKDSGEMKQVVPAIGEPFEFTLAELEQISKANPAALTTKAMADANKIDDGEV